MQVDKIFEYQIQEKFWRIYDERSVNKYFSQVFNMIEVEQKELEILQEDNKRLRMTLDSFQEQMGEISHIYVKANYLLSEWDKEFSDEKEQQKIAVETEFLDSIQKCELFYREKMKETHEKYQEEIVRIENDIEQLKIEEQTLVQKEEKLKHNIKNYLLDFNDEVKNIINDLFTVNDNIVQLTDVIERRNQMIK